MINKRPLAGYKVVELTTYIAAPSCGRLLADFGAEVIKIEASSGDVWRVCGPLLQCPSEEKENPLFEIHNANKRSIAIDMKSAKGMEIFHRILKQADVFLTNNRPAALKKMGIDYDQLKDIYPRLVYALVTGYGEEGPDCDLPGFDVIAYWSRSGFLTDLADPSGYPVSTASGFGDTTVGTALFGGICAALLDREKTGKGDKLSVSLYGAAIWYSNLMVVSTQYGDVYPRPRVAGSPMASPYRCKDGEWIMIAVIDFKKHFKLLCEVCDIPWAAEDPRFLTIKSMTENRAQLFPLLEEGFARYDSAAMAKRLAAAGIVYDVMHHFKDISKDPQAFANDYVRKIQYANGREAVFAMPPIKSEKHGKSDYTRAPFLGEHGEEILKELGYEKEQISALKKDGVI